MPAPEAARPSFPAGRVTALAGAGWGLVPGVAPAAGLAATIDVASPIAISVAAVFVPESRTAAPDDGFAFGLTYGEVVGRLVPIGQVAPTARLRLELCAGGRFGLLHAVVFSGTSTESRASAGRSRLRSPRGSSFRFRRSFEAWWSKSPWKPP